MVGRPDILGKLSLPTQWQAWLSTCLGLAFRPSLMSRFSSNTSNAYISVFGTVVGRIDPVFLLIGSCHGIGFFLHLLFSSSSGSPSPQCCPSIPAMQSFLPPSATQVHSLRFPLYFALPLRPFSLPQPHFVFMVFEVYFHSFSFLCGFFLSLEVFFLSPC